MLIHKATTILKNHHLCITITIILKMTTIMESRIDIKGTIIRSHPSSSVPLSGCRHPVSLFNLALNRIRDHLSRIVTVLRRGLLYHCQYMYRTLVRTWPLTTSPEAQKKGTVRLLVYHCRAQHRTFTQRTTWSENFLHRRSLYCIVLHRRSLWVTVQVIV